jgi:sugar porter (SP) family MFS transporter
MGYIWTISLVAAMGGLLFGYDWVVIGGAKVFFEPFFHFDTTAAQGWANSCALIGCLVGAVVSGGLSDKLGRKRLLLFAALLFTITSIGTALAQVSLTFIAWRLLGGVAIGLASNLSPMYIAEVAPAQLRGMFVSTNQLTIVLGIVGAQFINYRIARPMAEGIRPESLEYFQHWNTQFGWRWMFGVTAVPSFLFLVFMFLVPESPRWLAKNGKHEKARRVLSRIGGGAYADAALRDIEATLVNDIEKVNFADLLAPKMRKILALGVILAVFQQWCGINVMFNYADKIFQAAGFGVNAILLNISWTGAVCLVLTWVAIFTVDRLGRRILMLVGAAGLAMIYLVIGFAYRGHVGGTYVLVLVLSAIGCYSLSLAPITWVILSEIFPNRIRGAAMSVSVFALWTACFVLTYTFPVLEGALGMGNTFWVYAAICGLGFFYILARLPETKGRTLEEIERELVD